MNFIYTIDPTADEPIMVINRHIGEDEVEGQGIMGDQFQQELLTLDSLGKRRVEVWITSEGGSVIEGEKIYSAILHAKCKVDTYCMGLAASIAAVIFQAGRNRYMADYSKLMYHNVSGGLQSELKYYNDSIATMICERTGADKEKVLAMMARTTWILAPEAKEMGFCNEIISSSEANRGRLSKASNDLKAYKKEASLIMNKAIDDKKQLKIFNDKIHRKMNKVTNKLGLNPEASEESILEAIAAIENKAKASSEEMDSIKKKMEDSKEEYAKLKDEYDKLKCKNDASEKEAEDAKKAEAKNSAMLMVKGFVNKIGSDEKVHEKWVDTAIKIGVEEAKAMIEAIPVNKSGANFKQADTTNDLQLGSVVNRAMADLRTTHKI